MRKTRRIWLPLLSAAAFGMSGSVMADCGDLGGAGPGMFSSAPFTFWTWMGLNSPMVIGYMDGGTAADYPGEWACLGNAAGFAQLRYGSMGPAPTAGDVCTFQTTGSGTCTIRGSDGLPVELMEFSVETAEADDNH